ncbi:MAG: site-specific DNA-methyltransferase [Caldilineales bacterium]|nr:site-specific DNA-methyltransferase [Caldilineales bacterium]MCW5856816.1 site-specific DNA-methyltransferase [Caldilineales bacterium]
MQKIQTPRSQLFEQSGNSLDTVLLGDAWELSSAIPSESANCIITSPPYFGHREYAETEEIGKFEFGREDDPKEYVDKLVALFLEMRRILAPRGSIWLNLGDTYRDEQLLGIPWRVALGLQEQGWILRSEVIWNKPNAMPSSVKNRPTLSHEHVFLFVKARDYYYNADAIREPHVTFSENSRMTGGRGHFGKKDGTPENGKNKGNPNLHNGRWDQAFHPLGRNKRTVWEIPLSKFRDTHFAVFPEELVKTCILASTSEGDLVFDPFMGSGTTGVVAKRLGRHFLGIELVPRYVEMALKRLSETIYQPSLFSDTPVEAHLPRP